ncbi:hypothetical protein RhiirA4_473777 [Rhizophagus irregularis]|uniref:Uncharacterized protein n=1 Tax=Rhizophagus irregularis TaxID=588596 RepID=A0A2I1H7D9_9GLOM|nr:hypothetical protein RhiirA4_473777 [Rhizophagus irregularis]
MASRTGQKKFTDFLWKAVLDKRMMFQHDAQASTDMMSRHHADQITKYNIGFNSVSPSDTWALLVSSSDTWSLLGFGFRIIDFGWVLAFLGSYRYQLRFWALIDGFEAKASILGLWIASVLECSIGFQLPGIWESEPSEVY